MTTAHRTLIGIILILSVAVIIGFLRTRGTEPPAETAKPAVPSDQPAGRKNEAARPVTEKAKALRALAAEHMAESVRLRGVTPEERTRRLQPYIERYSTLCQEAKAEPGVQFECLRALTGLYATSGEEAAATAINDRILAMEPALPGATGRTAEQIHQSLEIYRLNGLDLAAENVLKNPSDSAHQARLVDFLDKQPDVFRAEDLAMLDGVASKALLAARTARLQPQALTISESVLSAVLAERPAAAGAGPVPEVDVDRWAEAAISAAATLKNQTRAEKLIALVSAHPRRLKRGVSYYAVLPQVGNGWEEAAKSSDFTAAAKRVLERGPADAFTPELMLRLAEAELKQEDYPAAARVLADLERQYPNEKRRPEDRELVLRAVFAQGEVFYRMDQRTQANIYWDRFIAQADPGDPRIQLIRSIRGTR